jgi:YspA, cpYpsA-related SLOG family
MIFVVCGRTHFRDDVALYAALDGLHKKYTCTLLMIGGGDGADTLASNWGKSRGIDQLVVPDNWERDGMTAFKIRNGRMLRTARALAEAEEKDWCVIAFPGQGETAYICRKARAAGMRVIEPMGENAHGR